jgi:hypothetical protein
VDNVDAGPALEVFEDVVDGLIFLIKLTDKHRVEKF